MSHQLRSITAPNTAALTNDTLVATGINGTSFKNRKVAANGSLGNFTAGDGGVFIRENPQPIQANVTQQIVKVTIGTLVAGKPNDILLNLIDTLNFAGTTMMPLGAQAIGVLSEKVTVDNQQYNTVQSAPAVLSTISSSFSQSPAPESKWDWTINIPSAAIANVQGKTIIFNLTYQHGN